MNIAVFCSGNGSNFQAIVDAKKQGRFGPEDFPYHSTKNVYTCPQGHELTARKASTVNRGRKIYTYSTCSSDCKKCPLKAQCLADKSRFKQIQRWEHQDVIDEHKERMQKSPGVMRQRGSLVEHPFGTLKHRAGMHHFLMRSLERCRGEFSLMVLAYNFTRVLNSIDLDTFRDYCIQRQENKVKNSQYA